MSIYFTTINQSQKPMKYTGMSLLYYLLGLLTICKIFSNSSTSLPGPDFQTEVRPDFSYLFVHLQTDKRSVAIAPKSLQSCHLLLEPFLDS